MAGSIIDEGRSIDETSGHHVLRLSQQTPEGCHPFIGASSCLRKRASKAMAVDPRFRGGDGAGRYMARPGEPRTSERSEGSLRPNLRRAKPFAALTLRVTFGDFEKARHHPPAVTGPRL